MNNLSIRKAIAAGRTLEELGYTYHDGELWKPPLGKSAEPLLDRINSLEDDLQFVERWAVHHGTKSHMTAENALSIIQHYPPISDITKSYADGKVPDTFNPFARITELEAQLEIERMRVAACGVAAMGNTEKSKTERITKDADRYLKLRRMAVELSLSHQVISQLVTNQGELDAAIAEGKA